MKREVKVVVRSLVAQGWTVTMTRNGHYRATPPTGGMPIFFGSTPSDYRGLRNTKALLRRNGALL